MNYLRSAILAVVSTSSLVFAAGCADAPEVTDEQAPKTEIGGEGLDPQAPAGGVCPASKPEFFQVQASRVAKYLFGGNDPFTEKEEGFSKEYGEYGMVAPKLNDECLKAAEFWHKLGESIWQYGGKDGGPTTWLGSAPNTTACGLKADLFTMTTRAFSDAEIARGVALTDYCWGEGVSGFIATGAAAQPPGTCATAGKGTDSKSTKTTYGRDGQCTPPVPGAIGFDPEPANLGAPLGASTGATADAKYTNTGVKTTVVEWPATFASGSYLVPGTPCSTYALPSGALTSRAIVAATPTSPLRKCM